jgi:hypothetical protein
MLSGPLPIHFNVANASVANLRKMSSIHVCFASQLSPSRKSESFIRVILSPYLTSAVATIDKYKADATDGGNDSLPRESADFAICFAARR